MISVYSIGAAWLCVGLLQDSLDTNVFYWVTQNIMGACICISFLSVIKLNSIKVATVLLLVAFVLCLQYNDIGGHKRWGS